MEADIQYHFWAGTADEIFAGMHTSPSGLTDTQVLARKGKKPKAKSPLLYDIRLLLSQYRNPLSLLLLFALVLSSILGDYKESAIIFGILFLSSLLSFTQERKANKAAERLRMLLQSKAKVKRNGETIEIPIAEVVPGDIVLLVAGDIIPADSFIVELEDLYVNESVLTGESFPAEKRLGPLAQDTPLKERKNALFKGTSVVSGTATAIAVHTGMDTELGKIESELSLASEETAFEKGIRRFGYLLMRVALLLAGIIMIVNIVAGKDPLDSILFALALSVGLAPEMLPAIVTITLSAGAKRLAEKKVIVKKLSSIQNLGAIDILCSDKTGTLTEGEVKIHSFLSVDGESSQLVQQYAYLNASFESGYSNPIDKAIREQSTTGISEYRKFDEVPYDFIRKRLSIVVANGETHTMITKGALKNIVEVCSQAKLANGDTVTMDAYRDKTMQLYKEWSAKGFRIIGLACKDVTGDPVINKDDEAGMVFIGFILLYDPPKNNISAVIQELKDKGIALKVITGDNTLIAESIAAQVGIPSHRIISGSELHSLGTEALAQRVDEIDIFSETEPAQKEQIVRALQARGHVVGYLGDGINDAPALKTADVGISVHNAVDVAKESADMILMEKELGVMSEGITEGRKTFMNTLKYIFITVSANFGNMFSMAGASVLLPFLPLLSSQILLTNFLTDIPALTIASDNVDEEMLQKPRKWNIRLIRQFMVVFGLESSVFDYLSFGLLVWVFNASAETFRTGWFIESVITEILILLVIRTRRSFIRSKVGKLLLLSSLLVIALVLVLPYTPLSHALGFVPLPLNLALMVCLISFLYALVGETTKRILFRKINY